MRFAGRSALVTGGGRGLGRAVALALAAEGAAVGVFSRTEAQVAGVADEIAAQGGRAVAIAGDVRSSDDVARCLDVIAAAFSRVEILVNAAGIFRMGPALDQDRGQLDELLATNLVGTYAMCQAFGRQMIERGSGKIVNFGSLLSFTAFPERAAYAASKGAVLQLTRTLGVEWAPHGVHVNAIVPGMIAIEDPHPAIVAGRLTSDEITRRIPAGRRGRPGDIVGPTLFLASPEADYVYGQTLVVDGGWLSYGYL